jgi:hypothetical protein
MKRATQGRDASTVDYGWARLAFASSFGPALDDA